MFYIGVLCYVEGFEILVVVIIVEDVEWFQCMVDVQEEVVVWFEMDVEMLLDVQLYNVVVEILGFEFFDEVVVMGGYYDFWDVGQGVYDDGVVCIVVWYVLILIYEFGMMLWCIFCVVLWINEENGFCGGQVYCESFGDVVFKYVVVIEMDGGNECFVGIGVIMGFCIGEFEFVYVMFEQIGVFLCGICVDEVLCCGGGVDIGLLMCEGVFGIVLCMVGEYYFDWYYMNVDIFDKVDLIDFCKVMVVLGVYGYVLVDMLGIFFGLIF